MKGLDLASFHVSRSERWVRFYDLQDKRLNLALNEAYFIKSACNIRL